jgi:hypothetical protein
VRLLQNKKMRVRKVLKFMHLHPFRNKASFVLLTFIFTDNIVIIYGGLQQQAEA